MLGDAHANVAKVVLTDQRWRSKEFEDREQKTSLWLLKMEAIH